MIVHSVLKQREYNDGIVEQVPLEQYGLPLMRLMMDQDSGRRLWDLLRRRASAEARKPYVSASPST